MVRLRCDRKRPCESCIRLGQASACTFQYPPQQSMRSGPTETTTQNVLQERIDQLESHVRSLLEKEKEQATTTDSTPESAASSEATAVGEDQKHLASEFGQIRLHKDGSSYVESDHWMSILNEISDLKDMVREQPDTAHNEGCGDAQISPGSDLFLLQTFPATKMVRVISTI
jgi:hypothetical protein